MTSGHLFAEVFTSPSYAETQCTADPFSITWSKSKKVVAVVIRLAVRYGLTLFSYCFGWIVWNRHHTGICGNCVVVWQFTQSQATLCSRTRNELAQESVQSSKLHVYIYIYIQNILYYDYITISRYEYTVPGPVSAKPPSQTHFLKPSSEMHQATRVIFWYCSHVMSLGMQKTSC